MNRASNSNTVSVIDGAKNKIIATILVELNPHSMAYNKYNKLLYVVNSGSHNVFVIDTTTNKVIKSILMHKTEDNAKHYFPFSITLRNFQNFLYVANYLNNSTKIMQIVNSFTTFANILLTKY